jgi:ribonuclease VapC
MIVDTSALLAILLKEPEAQLLDVVIANSVDCKMSAANFLEAALVLTARGGEAGAMDLDLLVARCGIQVVPFTEAQSRMARLAFARYGKGRHPAQLNFGDCMAYALAKDTGEELLFKGADFALTDVAVARY